MTWRRAILYYSVPTVLWLLLAAAYAFLTALGSISVWLLVLAVALIAALFLTAAASCFVLVLDAEDWWDDFRGQNRLALTCAGLLLATLAAGVSTGWWLTA